MKLKWVFGHQTLVPPINISSSTMKGVFYAAGSTGICYNWISNNQEMLLGHKGNIICATVTNDKTHLATADSGPDSSVIIWNLKTRKSVFVISGYYSKEGAISMAFSLDGLILMTLSGGNPQEVTLWDCKSQKRSPVLSYCFRSNEFQHHVVFHPKRFEHFASTSEKSVCFFKKDEKGLQSSILNLRKIYDEKMCIKAGKFTQTAFSSTSFLAFTSTTKGMVALWGLPLHKNSQVSGSDLPFQTICPEKRVCLRLLQLVINRCSIPFLSIVEDYLVVGTEESIVSYFDETFKLHWSINVNNGPIIAVSFNFKPRFTFKQAIMKALGKEIKRDNLFKEQNDFIVSTATGFSAYVDNILFKIQPILCGTSYAVKSVAVHPSEPYIYFGNSDLELQKWNYETKNIVCKIKLEDTFSEIQHLSIDCLGHYLG